MPTYTLPLFLLSGLAIAASTSPSVTYSTYLRDSFTPKAIATDSSGNVYMAGDAVVDPATSQSTVLVVKLNPAGSQYVYVRYIGGSVKDSANAIAVDTSGNVYVAGATASPDFPVTNGGNLGTAPTGLSSQRSFVTKLDPSGDIVFSDLLGGSAGSAAQAVAVNAAGQVIVTGSVSDGAGPAFPSTTGAYHIATTANHPYLLALDPTGKAIAFSATGIGGTALATDATGNIFVAGTTYLLDYPTTPGSYQPTFPVFTICTSAPCSGQFQGANQYVTKVDPTGSTLIYSTSVSGMGNTTNGGLAVDDAGNAYLTGYAGATYPYSVTPPTIPVGPVNSIFFFELPFLSKLDSAGKTLLFSIPVGGSGVAVDSHGPVYVSGGAGGGFAGPFGIANNLPVLANVPSQCLPNNAGIYRVAYVAQADGTTGELMGSQFIGGSTLATTGLALSGATAWVAGTTTLADFPLTPNAVTLPRFAPAPLLGAYLGAVDFSQPSPPAGTPQIACIVDAASLVPVGASPRYQLLTIFGTGLGPAQGIGALDNATTLLGGVSIDVDSVSAPLLYVSSTQINFAVPLVDPSLSLAAMKVTVGNANSAVRELPLTYSSNPSLFPSGAPAVVGSFGSAVLAYNTDGTVNSATNPAALGSAVSVFANGLAPDPRFNNLPLVLSTNNGWSVDGTTVVNPFVVRVDLQTPSALVNDFSCGSESVCAAGFTLWDVGFVSLGEFITGGPAFGGVVYVKR
jgi:uncharacterized protein (TIGR03437 family)